MMATSLMVAARCSLGLDYLCVNAHTLPYRKSIVTDFLVLVIVENGVKLRLNIVDTPGYGDQINNEGWYVNK